MKGDTWSLDYSTGDHLQRCHQRLREVRALGACTVDAGQQGEPSLRVVGVVLLLGGTTLQPKPKIHLKIQNQKKHCTDLIEMSRPGDCETLDHLLLS